MTPRARTLLRNAASTLAVAGTCTLLGACGGATGGSTGSGTPSDGGAGGASSGGAAGSGVSGGGGSVGSGGAGGATNAGGVNSTGGATASGGAATREPDRCTVDSDCTVFEDCCFCEPVAKANPPTGCPADCKTGACTVSGGTRPGAKCAAGRCVFDRPCATSTVTCKSIAPSCAPGTAPEIDQDCYTGRCIPAEYCSDVDSCDTCRAEGLACVRYEAFVQSVHCVRKPPGCDVPTCACMDACGGISCGEASDGTIGCFCPSC